MKRILMGSILALTWALVPLASADDLAVWTFEVSIPTTAGPHAAEGGVNGGQALGWHASGSTVYSNPVGNGSNESFSSNFWAIGDYYQFRTSTVGYHDITIAWDQTRSSTGPGTFDLAWSTDGTTFTTFLTDYTVLENNVANGGTWNSTTRIANYQFGPVAAPAALNNQANVYFRLINKVTPGGTGGSNRVDNVVVAGTGTVPTGACCYGGNLCEIKTEAQCAALGGTWLGQGTTCDNNPCNYPTGACCVNTFCSIHTLQDCTTLGGTYLGDGTTCGGPSPCIGDSTIAQAKAGGVGKAVRLKDVTVSSTTDLIASANNKSFQLQDATGGITVFGTNADIDALLAQFAEGDKITLEGATSSFSGLFELVAPFPYVVNGGPVGVPTPIVVTSTDFADNSPTAEGYESELVKVRCVTFGVTGNFAGQTNYTVTDPNGSFVVRIATGDLDLVGQPIPTGPVHITGIFSQNAASPYTTGYQLLPRKQADLVDAPECIPTGACCTGETCTVLTQAQCVNAGGTYKGDGTGCTPNPCVGACCYQNNCTLQLQANCLSLGGEFLGYGTQCVPFVCPVPVLPGDIALGLSTASASTTAEHVRAGAKIGSWPSQAYLQSMEFDNAGGTLHSAAGNLLALNYGAGAGTGQPPDCTDPNRPDQAGKLYNLATNGTNGNELLYDFRTGIACTRIGGLGVSPNNHYLALWGYDTSSLYVLAYDAGAAVGTGSGASITNAWSYAPTSSVAPGTEGTTWLDDDTILLYTVQFGTGLTDLSTVDFIAGVFTQTVRASFDIGTTPASIFTDVEYNPTVSPYVFCLFSNRGGTPPATTNKLTAINPSDWSVVKQVDLSISLNTAREIALGPDKFLYVSQYHSGTNVPYIDRLDATNPAAWTDNSSTDYYLGDTYSPFNGLDVAFGPAGCRGDFNCDGLIDFLDIDPFVAVLSGGSCCDNTGYNCDVNGDGTVDFGDIDPFVELLSSGATCP